MTRSAMQDTVKLSVTEAELDSATSNVQDMLHVKNIMESLGLKVKLPMILKQGVRDIVNGWSVGCQTRHVATKQMFLRELKEKGILKKWSMSLEILCRMMCLPKSCQDLCFANTLHTTLERSKSWIHESGGTLQHRVRESAGSRKSEWVQNCRESTRIKEIARKCHACPY